LNFKCSADYDNFFSPCLPDIAALHVMADTTVSVQPMTVTIQ